MAKRRARRKTSKPRKFCDPGVCDCCQYIGEGDFLCDKHMEIVVSDWTPTENYPMCQSQGKAVVVRPVDGITINTELEFLLDDGGEVRMFDSPEQAQSLLTAAGVEPEELRHMTILESCGICRKCGSPLFKSLLPGYDYQCFTCDEDFYKFEQDT